MRVFFFLFSALLFSACTSSSLLVSPHNTLDLQHKNTSVKIASSVLEKQVQSYENIEIAQYKLKRDESVLFYEHVTTDINWEFRYGSVYNLKYIFDGTKANIVYKDSQVTFLQLKISNETYINIFAESSGFKDFSYVYGFSNEAFSVLIDQVSQTEKNAQSLIYNVPAFDDKSTPMSKWSVIKLLLSPFLKPDVRSVSGL